MKPLPFKIRRESELEKWRVDTFWTKEPETIAWIDSFERNSTFLDIGANIGIYSLYAASRYCRVLAVEPQPENVVALEHNIGLNKSFLILSLLAGCGNDRASLVDFSYPSIEAGATGGCYRGQFEHSMRIPIYSVDELCARYWTFDHIKIDIDGGEADVVDGMATAIMAHSFESCLIELDRSSPDANVRAESIILRLEMAGYTRDNKFNRMSPHSRERRKQEGIQVENVIFTRID